ncbi:hypothetical protein ABPG72_006935 [Tetrahymena utriculariae]
MKKFCLYSFLGFLIACIAVYFIDTEDEIFWLKSFSERMEIQNYPHQTHFFITEDKWNITIFRIAAKGSHQKAFKKDYRAKPIILIPQLLNCVDSYVINDEELSLAFVLANAGFDVWLVTNRGSEYSPNLDKIEEEYSFHEMGYYDLSMAFEYVHNVTNQKVSGLGHSQGANVILVALSEKRLNHVDKVFIIAPGTHIKSASYLTDWLAKSNLPEDLYKSQKQVGSKTRFGNKMSKYTPFISRAITLFFCDGWESELNLKNVFRIASHDLQPTSTKNLLHWAQLKRLGGFFKFDYGKEKNLQIYNQASPPQYDLSNITESIHIFHGIHDLLTTQEEMMELYNTFKNGKAKNVTYQEYEKSGHISFMLGRSAQYTLDLIRILNDD